MEFNKQNGPKTTGCVECGRKAGIVMVKAPVECWACEQEAVVVAFCGVCRAFGCMQCTQGEPVAPHDRSADAV